MIWILSYLLIGTVCYGIWYAYQGAIGLESDCLLLVLIMILWPILLSVVLFWGIAIGFCWLIQCLVDELKKLC